MLDRFFIQLFDSLQPEFVMEKSRQVRVVEPGAFVQQLFPGGLRFWKRSQRLQLHKKPCGPDTGGCSRSARRPASGGRTPPRCGRGECRRLPVDGDSLAIRRRLIGRDFLRKMELQRGVAPQRWHQPGRFIEPPFSIQPGQRLQHVIRAVASRNDWSGPEEVKSPSPPVSVPNIGF